MVQEGQDFVLAGNSSNREHTITAVGEDADPFGMNDGESVELDKAPFGEVDKLTSAQELRREIDPRDIQENRPEAAREADAAKDAELTSDPLQWASDPTRYDFPGVDTGPTFRDEQTGDFDTDSFIDGLDF